MDTSMKELNMNEMAMVNGGFNVEGALDGASIGWAAGGYTGAIVGSVIAGPVGTLPGALIGIGTGTACGAIIGGFI